MLPSGFVHLSVHTAFSLAEGAIQIKDLVSKCIQENMPAVCITDTGNLFGALEFAVKASEVGLQPIICLLYTSPSPRDQRGSRMPSSA